MSFKNLQKSIYTNDELYIMDQACFLLVSSFETVLQTTAWPRWISGQVLSSHSIVSSSRTIRPCSPWGGRWIEHWRITWSYCCAVRAPPEPFHFL